MQYAVTGPETNLVGQAKFVVLGIASEWGLPPSAATEIATLLTEMFATANFSEESSSDESGTDECQNSADTTVTSFQPFAHVVDGGELAGTWDLSCAEESGGRSAEWTTGWTTFAGRYDSASPVYGHAGIAVLRCRERRERVLWLAFDPDTRSDPNVKSGVGGWIWIGPSQESAEAEVPLVDAR